MKFKIICYIPVDVGGPELFDSRADALAEASELQKVQPENIYEIEEAEER